MGGIRGCFIAADDTWRGRLDIKDSRALESSSRAPRSTERGRSGTKLISIEKHAGNARPARVTAGGLISRPSEVSSERY